ncbi:desmoplakin isoform X2 [Solea senegalensis]|uniref:Desmoplakin isoform X2 n=1 Tax=Solea senegalensis TaxID=28829 RepID=A0AAV6T5H0_SOLSE|nr:desmoplakin isoform X2 [Solea senegalensis]KAG7524699.1 desmoplakin isoform X2 [Solea senegalensis]
MSLSGSTSRLATMGTRSNSRPDLMGASFRNEVLMSGNGFQPEFQTGDGGYTYTTFSKSSMHGGGHGGQKTHISMGGGSGGGISPQAFQQRAMYLTSQCHDFLQRAKMMIQGGAPTVEVEKLLMMSAETLEQLKMCGLEMQQMRIHNDVFKSVDQFQNMQVTLQQQVGMVKRRNRGSVGSLDGGRVFNDAMGWIAQQKRMIETAPWGDDSATIEKQILSHNKTHSSIQRSHEVDRAREELRGDKYNLSILDQEWDSLQKMSHSRFSQLRELQNIIEEISRAIMWVNKREEEELMFDWGDKNMDNYIPKKQESYSRMMSDLEEKEKELNKLKMKADGLLNNNHPAGDKIEAYMDTLQTQWSWLLQITKCIQVHLKENAAYSQFFKEANDTYAKLQQQHETIRTKFTCDKNTPLENLTDLLKNLERERERIIENKRQVQSLVSKSKTIVRLKPRNPEERSSSPIIIQALCDFKQDQIGIFKGNEGILKDNSQRSKWLVTGPGGLDMLIPSVCLLIPPPNPLSIGLANKNEQYYEAIMGIWNQLYINIKSLISWQYCLKDINYINSLTVSVLSKMHPDEYRNIIKRLETHYQEFLRTSQTSELFGDDEKKNIQGHFDKAYNHYDTLVIQLLSNTNTIGEENDVEETKVAPSKTTPPPKVPKMSLVLLSSLQEIRRRLELAESGLTSHLHIPLGENSVHECSVHIQKLQTVHQDLDSIHDEYLRIRERITKQLEGLPADSEQAKFLRSEQEIINQKIGMLQGLYSAYLHRLNALKALLQSLLQAEDIIQVHEARLVEKETTSLDLREVENYRSTLKQMKSDLEQKRDLLTSMESNLGKAVHWNDQISGSFYKCDVELSKYSDLVGQMSDRWRRIQSQIDSRMWDLEKHENQLKHYQQDRTSLEQWIDNARKRQDTLQTVKLSDMQILMDHINQQKALHTEIKGKKDKVEDVNKNADTCATSIKDYEIQLASYSSGLETLRNIPIKRTMIQSPASVVRQEAADLQSHYIELLTRSSDYYKFLGELRKNMEDIKLRNTRIEMLEEELRRMKGDFQDSNQKNKSLEDDLARYKLELERSKEEHFRILEEKRIIAVNASSTKESLDGSHSQLQDLKDQLTRIKYQLDEEKSKKRLAEERYTSQQEEFEAAVRRRQKELEELNWTKIDLEKSVKDKERELERMKMLLDEEAARRRNAESEMSKTSISVHESQSKYSEILLEKDSLLSRLKLLEQDKNRHQRTEDELKRIKLTLETEVRNKQRLLDEKNSLLKDFNSMKSQYELREGLIKQCESDREKSNRERLSLKSEIERLMRELKTIEERYKSRLLISEKEASELALKRDALLREIQRLQQRPSTLNRQTQTDEKVPTIDPSKLVFDAVRRRVTAHQLCDCGVISKATLEQLLKGQKSVDEVAVDIQLNLKGTGIIAGMITGAQGKMPFTKAKNKKLLSPESALLLLEAQAATGYIVDPTLNEKMPVDTACSRGIVDSEDRDVLVTAEAASTGFKDPYSGKVLSVGQACKQGHINKDTAIRLLQAQDSVGGILDPVLSVFLPKDLALDRNLIDEELYRALNKKPTCYLDPATGEKISYSDLRKKCTVEPVNGLLLLRGPEKPMTVKGLRGEVSITDLVNSELLDKTDIDKLNQGKLTSKDIEDKLKTYLYGSTCIAGIYDEAKDRIMPFYQAMREGLMMRGTTLELLEAQAASGFIVDPVNNVFLTVEEASKRALIGNEFKNKLLSAEKAVTGYKDPATGKIISLFQAIEKDLIEKGHGIRLLEAQIASGGIIDPKESHRIDVDVAYKRGYFDEEMNEILTYEGDDTKGFFDPNTKENLTYLQLKDRCITDAKTGLILLPLKDKNKAQKSQESRTNVLRKRRVVIVDPDTGLEMSVREAYHRELIDYDTFLDLSEQECEWEEITIKASDGSARLVIVDRKTGSQYDIQDCLERGIIEQKSLDQYRAGTLTLTQFADQIISKNSSSELTISASSVDDMVTCSSPTQAAPSSPTVRKRLNSISITVSPPEMFDDQSPVAAIFDTETLEKITIPEGHRRGIVDTITAQRLLEAQACTGGIINPATGERLSLQDAVRQSIIDESMANKLKPAQKAYVGFEDVKTKRKMSAAEAVKETWLPYEAGQRFIEFQYLTGGLIEPGSGRRITIEEAIRKGWLDGQGAQKLQESRNHQKNLTCPKTKLKISYKQAMDGCMVEESNGMKMLQASSISSKGISSPYNVSNPGSRSGSRPGSHAGSRSGSRRGSVDYSSTYTYSFSSNSTTYSNNS